MATGAPNAVFTTADDTSSPLLEAKPPKGGVLLSIGIKTMRRYNYGQNFTAQQTSGFGWLTPLGFLETVPGDTVSGKWTVSSWSDTTHRPIMNRTYMDTFAFYIPFRLLWDGFPEFIKDKDAPGPQPNILD